MYNNFDVSSTGTDITLNIHWDGDMARIKFEESLHSGRDLDISELDGDELIFSHYGNISVKDFEKEYNVNCTAKELFKKYYNHVYAHDITLAGFTNLRDLIIDLGNDLDDMQSLQDHIETHIGGTKEFKEFLAEHFDAKFFTLTSKGYSQGDVRTVIIPSEALESAGLPATQESADQFQDEIDHLIWDTPIYCHIEVDGEDYNLSNDVADPYKYEQDEIKKLINEGMELDEGAKATLNSFLEEKLPADLKYVH
ncbi:conserved hypothetical protein [Vibrio chagasii]|nr:conserved hypothetical protein [Vibrio chagasii]